MAETQVTRCPHCQTTFRIRLEQLTAARGAVRCGSCLQVFKAIDHIVSSRESAPAANPQTSSSRSNDQVALAAIAAAKEEARKKAAREAAAKKAAAEKQAKERADALRKQQALKARQEKARREKALLEQKKRQELEQKKRLLAQKKAAQQKAEQQARLKAQQAQALKQQKIQDDFDDIPDQIADDPMEDLGIRQSGNSRDEDFNLGLQLDDSVFSMQEPVKPSRYSLLNNDPAMELHEDFEDSLTQDSSWGSSDSDDDDMIGGGDESWAAALLDDEPENPQKAPASNASQNRQSQKEPDDFVPSFDDDQSDKDQFHLNGTDESDDGTLEIDLSVSGAVSRLQDEPLALNQAEQSGISRRKWLWTLASLVMLAVMAAQVGYFRFSEWSRHPTYRPAYQIACDVIGCKLPAIQDISKMTTQHFVVQSHPDVEQALSVDTLLVNTATYEQPFPDVRLIFTGLNDQIIAERTFSPSEYLSGELSGATLMPVRTPIHIALEILDPGPSAVGYRIELASNN